MASYRHLVKNSKLILNGGILPEEGAELINLGAVDAVSFGLNYLKHPDLAKRVLLGKPLDNVLNVKHIYGAGNQDLHIGYTDYPAANYDDCVPA